MRPAAAVRRSFAVVAMLSAAAIHADDDVASRAARLLDAHRAGEAAPVLSASDAGLDSDGAYQIQTAYVAKRRESESLAGFKAGVTSRAAQARWELDAPVAGVLFESGRRAAGATVGLSAYHRPLVEVEIGFVVGAPIAAPLPDAAALRARIDLVVPVIELPDVGFAEPDLVQGPDIIAANVGAAQYVVGTVRALAGVDPNAVNVVLKRDGERLTRGRGRDALGNQWEAALWLVNRAIDLGYSVEPGHLLITGALGEAVPARPGRYLADYGELGSVRFTLR